MQQPSCDICGDPTDDTSYVCRRDSRITAGHLRDVVELAADVEVTVARLARYTDRGGQDPQLIEPDGEDDPASVVLPVMGHGWPATQEAPLARRGALRPSPLPVNLNAVKLANHAINTIVTWSRHVTEQRGIGVPRPGPVTGPLCRAGWGCKHPTCALIRAKTIPHPAARAAEFLLDHLDWLRHRPEAAEANDELRAAGATLLRVVDSPPPLTYAGPCWTELGDGGCCDVELYAVQGSGTVTCLGCAAAHDVDKRRVWLLSEAEGVLGHAGLLAAALSALHQQVTSSMIRNYADRGRLVAHGHDGHGRPLYRVGDVLDVLADVARRKGAAA